MFEYLDLQDLCIAADTCTKFRAIAMDIIKKEYSVVNESTIDEMDARTCARFLRNFGSKFIKFELNCDKTIFGSPQRYVEKFFENCAVPDNSLKSLKIMNMSNELRRKNLQPLSFIVSRLKSFETDNYQGIRHTFGRGSTGQS